MLMKLPYALGIPIVHLPPWLLLSGKNWKLIPRALSFLLSSGPGGKSLRRPIRSSPLSLRCEKNTSLYLTLRLLLMDWGSLYRRSIFTTSYRQKGSHVYSDEHCWSGKCGTALSSMLAVLTQDPDTGLIDYGIADILQKDESDVVLEFLDFYN